MKNILLQGLIVWFSLNSLVLADLIRPSNNSEISFIHVLFEWDQEADANEYNLQLSKSSNFQNLLIDESILENVYIYKGEIDWDDGYYWRVRPIDADGNVGDWVNTFTFEILDDRRGSIDVDVIDGDQTDGGLTLMGSIGNDYYSIVIDEDGREVWNDDNLNINVNHVNEYGQLSGYSTNGPWPTNTGILINYDNDITWNGPANEEYVDIHEVKSIPGGHYMGFTWKFEDGPIPLGSWTNIFQSFGYEADGETLEFPWAGQRITEWDEEGNIVWDWDPFEHFTMDDYDAYGGTWWAALQSGYYDWMHSNAFHFDEIESVIYFSSRHLSRLTKIAYPSGEVIWMMGMPAEYMASGDEHICTELGFSWQHNVQLLDNGNILFFDNGNLSELFGDSEPTTRIWEVHVVDDSYCEVIWEYQLSDDLHGPWMGSVQLLNNGNYMINTVGGGGHAIEVTQEQEVVSDIDWDIGPFDDPTTNYRSYRIPSIHPDAFGVIFDDYEIINLDGISTEGISLDDGSLTLSVSNASGYEQLYSYHLSDTEGWFEQSEYEFSILPYETVALQLSAQNINTGSTELNFKIFPVHHQYSSKDLNFTIYNQQIQGDINSDGVVNVIDVVILVSVILGNTEETPAADINGDGIFNVLDVVTLVNIILGD